ncbi:MAG: cytochrome P450, partial [Acidimicrobiales bacterium]
TIKAGQQVVLMYPSANRDPAHFAEPDRFDVTRHPNPHLAFGFGTHFCLGAALARLEGRIAIEEMVRRWPELTIDEDGLRRVHMSNVAGYANVPVTVG